MLALHRLAAGLVLAFPLAAFGVEQPARIAPPVSATVTFDLEQDVKRTLRDFDVPGMARGFGVRKLGEAAPVDGKTIFEVASNSKAFTAAALAMLVDEGKLAWDDKVTAHLPDFQMYDAYVTHEMTIRDLLWWPTTQFSTDEIIHRLRFVKPATSFRNSYAYDNLLYIVAGKIIAQKSGKDWGTTVRERILAPLGMTGTTVSLDENAKLGNVSAPHSKINGKAAVVKAMPVANAVGAVGINTSAEDIAKWMNVLLAEGKMADGKRLFSEKQAREMWTAQTPMKISEPKPALAATKPNFFAYGLGFQLRDYLGRKVAMHGGALQGFYSRVLLVPQEKLGIAILTNAESSPAMTALQYRILDQYLGGRPTDWVKLYADAEREETAKDKEKQKASMAQRAKSGPSLPLASYDGEYTDAWYGKVSIALEGGKRIMRFSRTPDLQGELENFQYDTFIVRWKERNFNADAYVTFALKPDGSIDTMKMEAISSETDFSYDFHDLLFTPVKKAKP